MVRIAPIWSKIENSSSRPKSGRSEIFQALSRNLNSKSLQSIKHKKIGKSTVGYSQDMHGFL